MVLPSASFWSTLLLRPAWRLSRGHRHVSLRRLSEEFRLSWSCRLRGSHMEIWYAISFTHRIWKSRSLCLGVACGVQVGFFGRSWYVSRAQILGSTVDTSVAALLDELHLFSTAKRARILKCFFFVLFRNGEVCSVNASVYVAETRDDGQHF